ncbi:piggyBac transposable element-derived protein 4-like [Mizuhopecten yessoensis]|uniref:piggyBac transposable element-derived protein 4-like n=1 Tax=Mizuhopecten yessoensis TaxID=6573 RepID=UPI000B45D48B|nr:piggyBac transposable element-derived protein 4-like [Mizuhopecten yessoensis]
MADDEEIFEDAAEQAVFLDEYFGESDSDQDGFDGFDIEDINLNAEGAIVREIAMDQSTRDREFPEDFAWSREDSPPVCAPFTGNPGIKFDTQGMEPIDFFHKFIPNEFVELMVTQTNLYAQRKIEENQENMKPHSRISKWYDVTALELKVFLALFITMGIVKKSQLDEYWSTSEIGETPLFGKHMSKDRFHAILSNLHIVNNKDAIPVGQVGHDPLFKVRPLIDLLDTKFTEMYNADENLSFDEATCPFKGRVKFRVYNPAKPNKFGIKLYQVCEAESGYTVRFDVYHGETNCIIYCEELDLDPDISTKIVIGLLCKCGALDKGHNIYLDNYYNSPELAEDLNLLNTYMCGTLRKNRKGVPKAIQSVKLKAGDTIYRRKGNTLVVQFPDKRDVHMISTIHAATDTVLNKTDKHGIPIIKPTCVVDYCAKMGGVDLSDQVIQYYDILRKTVKWWRKLFFHLVNVAITNAFIWYKKDQNGTDRNVHVKFRKSIVSALLEEGADAPKPKSRGGKTCTTATDRTPLFIIQRRERGSKA